MSYISDMGVDHRYIGVGTAMHPLSKFAGTQRVVMGNTYSAQAQVLHGNEHARFSSGWDEIIGKYEMSEKLASSIQIIAVIPKFNLSIGEFQIRENPTKTIIFRKLDTKEIDIMDISTYTALADGFGYFNTMLQVNNIGVGNLINKGSRFTTSPNHDDGIYNLGVNANTVKYTLMEVTEDAYVISDELAEKMSNTAICKVVMQIPEKKMPLPISDVDGDCKIFPDIGDTINSEGILMTLRKKNAESFLSDTRMNNDSIIEHLHDTTFKGEPGAKVIDIDVYINKGKLSEKKGHDKAFSQILKYADHQEKYFKEIISVYDELKKNPNTKFTDRMLSIVKRCLVLCPKHDRNIKNKQLLNKKDPIELAQITITYAFTRKVGKGWKISGKSGDKGCIQAVWKKENMPVDSDGVVADLISCPLTMPSRLNPSQDYESFYNRAGVNATRTIRDKMRSGEFTITTAYDYALGFFHDVRPTYARFLKDTLNSKKLRDAFVNGILDDGIYIVSPPFSDEISEHNILPLSEKYDVVPKEISYIKVNKNSTEKIIFKQPGIIGSKYIYLLYKVPRPQLSVVEAAYVSHLGIPIRPANKTIRNQNLQSPTPLKLGEGETSMLMQSLDPEDVMRFRSVNSGSLVGFRKLVEELITADKPTCIEKLDISTKELMDSNISNQIVKHILAIGVGVTERSKDEEI